MFLIVIYKIYLSSIHLYLRASDYATKSLVWWLNTLRLISKERNLLAIFELWSMIPLAILQLFLNSR